MDLTPYRASEKEQERINDLMALIPRKSGVVLDVGARDGYLSYILANFFDLVIAVDLKKLDIHHEKVQPVQGDITSLCFHDDSFDLVLCAEVLEHIPPHSLTQACSELCRVAKHFAIVGVPYKQDIRLGRTTCSSCGKKNPPWGHINVFDEVRLKNLFSGLAYERTSFVGEADTRTNFLSRFFMDLAGNPYGTYSQEEACIFCGSRLGQPSKRNFFQKVCTKFAVYLNWAQKPFVNPHPSWIHVLFKKC